MGGLCAHISSLLEYKMLLIAICSILAFNSINWDLNDFSVNAEEYLMRAWSLQAMTMQDVADLVCTNRTTYYIFNFVASVSLTSTS